MRQQLPGGLSREILEKVAMKRLEDKHGDGSATAMVIESYTPFRATIEAVDPNSVWTHVYVIFQEGDCFFLEFQKTREEAKKPPQGMTFNLGEILRNALSKKK